jgi:hypothetical protein
MAEQLARRQVAARIEVGGLLSHAGMFEKKRHPPENLCSGGCLAVPTFSSPFTRVHSEPLWRDKAWIRLVSSV